MVIGSYPALSLKEARQVRDESASLVAKGISPKQNKNKVTSVLFSDYGERYLNEVIKKERKNPYNMILCLNNDIYPMIGHIALDQISVDDVRRVIWRKKEQGYDAAANQVRGLLKRMFDYAMTLGLVPYNPVLAIPSRHVHKAKPRDRYLSTNEIRTYYTTLLNSRIYRPRKLGLLLSLLTLVRKSELLRAKWEHIDKVHQTLFIPHTKNGKSRILHMNHMAMQVLQDTPVIAGNPFLFPGQKPGQPLNNVTKPFNRMLKRAQIEGQVCIHTCRHSVAALIVSSGGTLYDVQAQLGHSSSQSSQRYAHLHASRLRHTSAQVANCVEQALIAPSSVKAESISLQRAG